MIQKESSRRNFLKLAAGSTLAAGLAPSAVAAGHSSAAPSDAIHVATIGMGASSWAASA